MCTVELTDFIICIICAHCKRPLDYSNLFTINGHYGYTTDTVIWTKKRLYDVIEYSPVQTNRRLYSESVVSIDDRGVYPPRGRGASPQMVRWVP